MVTRIIGLALVSVTGAAVAVILLWPAIAPQGAGAGIGPQFATVVQPAMNDYITDHGIYGGGPDPWVFTCKDTQVNYPAQTETLICHVHVKAP